MAGDVWADIESTLRKISALPHNVARLRGSGLVPEDEVGQKLREVRRGMIGTPIKEEFAGPKTFLRVAGTANRVFSGEWWFDAALLGKLDQAYSRIYLNGSELKQALRTMLRETLAISKHWNSIGTIWALQLPAGETLGAYSGIAAPQTLFGSAPLTQAGNRLLTGGARQYFFPVKNPLWITQIRDFT